MSGLETHLLHALLLCSYAMHENAFSKSSTSSNAHDSLGQTLVEIELRDVGLVEVFYTFVADIECKKSSASSITSLVSP